MKRWSAEAPVYLDYQATTPMDPRVLEAMLPYFSGKFGNPHSASHAYGREAETAVEAARAQVAALIGATPREIVFTSGATESNNLALKGAAHFHRASKNHVVTCATEHSCVLETVRHLGREGFAVTILDVHPDGLVDLEWLRQAVSDETVVVSIMAVNNEIGVIQPLAEIGAICRRHGAYFHTDAAQAVGKIPLDVGAMSIDLMSISGHKLYGPKGIGALYVRRKPRVRIEAQIDGGGQERGLRSGTLSPPLCVGLGTACALAAREMADEGARIRALRDRLLEGITSRLDEVSVNGDVEHRIPGNLNLTFAGIDAGQLLAAADDLALSTGSACMSASMAPSYVIKALGRDDAAAIASVRIGLGRFTDADQVDHAARRIAEEVSALRSSRRPPRSQAATKVGAGA